VTERLLQNLISDATVVEVARPPPASSHAPISASPCHVGGYPGATVVEVVQPDARNRPAVFGTGTRSHFQPSQ
jgi:hypothetical protein